MSAGRSVGVLERVGQSLLSHPEHGQLDTIGEFVWVSIEVHRHRYPSGVHACEQLVEPAETRLRLERVRRGLIA